MYIVWVPINFYAFPCTSSQDILVSCCLMKTRGGSSYAASAPGVEPVHAWLVSKGMKRDRVDVMTKESGLL